MDGTAGPSRITCRGFECSRFQVQYVQKTAEVKVAVLQAGSDMDVLSIVEGSSDGSESPHRSSFGPANPRLSGCSLRVFCSQSPGSAVRRKVLWRVPSALSMGLQAASAWTAAVAELRSTVICLSRHGLRKSQGLLMATGAKRAPALITMTSG